MSSARATNVSGEKSGSSPEELDLLRRSREKEKLARKPLSYKEIVSGINDDGSNREKEPFSYGDSGMDDETVGAEAEEILGLEAQDYDPLCPVVRVTKQELKEAREPWRKAIVVKLVGKNVGLNFMKGRLERLWQPSGEMEVIDLNHGFFVVRLSNEVDYKHVYYGGPWAMLGHCFLIQQWKPEFRPAKGDRAWESHGVGSHPGFPGGVLC